MTSEERELVFPSVDDCKPPEEGGPIARIGFSYQDEIAVSSLIGMLETPAILKVHCESHDDVLVVSIEEDQERKSAEFIQVKASEQDKHWSIAGLCERTKGRAGTSIFEKSLSRDACGEVSRFRIVTLRAVNKDLECLTYPLGSPGRELSSDRMSKLRLDLDRYCPGVVSKKGHGSVYWLSNCMWEVRASRESVATDNHLRILKLSSRGCFPLLLDQGKVLLDELRTRVKEASLARWEPDRDKKIITRDDLLEWWDRRSQEMSEGVKSPSGGKLRVKMEDADLPDEIIKLAQELRRDYAARVRTTTYMEPGEREQLVGQVKSTLMSLRSRFVAGDLDVNGNGFHALCVSKMDELGGAVGGRDQAAFVKGCMYDITDRCLHRFARTDR